MQRFSGFLPSRAPRCVTHAYAELAHLRGQLVGLLTVIEQAAIGQQVEP
jgi:hypothetical protein